MYHFDISLLFNSGSTQDWCGAFLYVNGAMRWDALGGSFQSAYDYQYVHRAGTIQLQAGDYVEVYIRDNGGDGFVYDGNPYSWFSGHLIG